MLKYLAVLWVLCVAALIVASCLTNGGRTLYPPRGHEYGQLICVLLTSGTIILGTVVPGWFAFTAGENRFEKNQMGMIFGFIGFAVSMFFSLWLMSSL